MNVSKYTLRVLVAVGAASLLTGVRPPPAHGELICPPVDLVFVMDTSGSMDDEAAALCSNIAQVVTDLAGLGVEVNPSFLGIIQDGSANPRFPCLTDNVLDLLGSPVPGDSSCGSNLGNLEDWGAGTAIVSDRFPWAEGAIRVIVPISDEGACKGNPCNDPGDDRSAVANAIQIANANGVFVSPITGTGSTKCVIDLATDLALATGGITFQSTNPDADLAGAISAIVTEACESYSDCNSNGVSDTRDIAEGTSQDCNVNSAPDECDLAAGTSRDCNSNGIPDECDLAGGTSEDCNNNSIPDECDLAAGTSSDVNSNGVPDECDECTADADCDDGLYCTGVETCVNAKCQASGDPCVDLGLACDEA